MFEDMFEYGKEELDLDRIVNAVRKNSQEIIDTDIAKMKVKNWWLKQPDESEQWALVEWIYNFDSIKRIDTINMPVFIARITRPEQSIKNTLVNIDNIRTFTLQTREYRLRDKSVVNLIPILSGVKTVFIRSWMEYPELTAKAQPAHGWMINIAYSHKRLYPWT